MVGAKHTYTGAKLGSSKRDHVLPYMSRDPLTVLRRGVGEDILDQVVAVLVAGDIDEGNARAADAAFADSIKVSTQKIWTANLQAFLDNLGSKLVHAILGGVANNMIDSSATVGGCSMLADVLNAPVAELAVGDDIDVGEDLFNTRTLCHFC